MNDSKFLKIAIVILLIINISTLAFFSFRPHGPRPPHPGMGPGRGPFEFLVRELKMTDEQKSKYETLRDQHHEAVESLREQSHDMHKAFFDLINAEPIDSIRVKNLADSISENQKQIELITFYHFKEVRSICTPEQQKRFDVIIDDALRMLQPPHRPN